MFRSLRTDEELSEIFALAKINESDLCNVTQILYSKDENDTSNMKLMELDKHLLESITEGDR